MYNKTNKIIIGVEFMKKKILSVVFACIISAVVLAYGLYRLVQQSKDYKISVTLYIGSRPVPITMSVGATLLLPTNAQSSNAIVNNADGSVTTTGLNMTGYNTEFLGWFYDAEGTKPFDPSEKLRYDTAIYAVFAEEDGGRTNR